MKLYWIKAQAPRRVLALMKHLGIEAEFIDLTKGGLKTPEIAALNPNMKAPILVDGDRVLWEASAIMAYLCIKRGSDMWPAQDAEAQVEVLQWLSWNDWHWGPAVSPFYFEHVVRPTFGLGVPNRASLRAKVPDLVRYAKVLDSRLAGREYAALNRLTIADFQLASMAADWRVSEMPFDSFSNIVRWLDRLEHIPAWADPWPKDARRAA